LPIELREWLAPEFSPSVLRLARKAERDALLAHMAADLAGSASAVAAAVRERVASYARSGWKYERDRRTSADSRHAAAHRLLTLDGGKIPEVENIRKILRLGKNSAEISQRIDPCSDHGGEHEGFADDPDEGHECRTPRG